MLQSAPRIVATWRRRKIQMIIARLNIGVEIRGACISADAIARDNSAAIQTRSSGSSRRSGVYNASRCCRTPNRETFPDATLQVTKKRSVYPSYSPIPGHPAPPRSIQPRLNQDFDDRAPLSPASGASLRYEHVPRFFCAAGRRNPPAIDPLEIGSSSRRRKNTGGPSNATAVSDDLSLTELISLRRPFVV